ncbi:type II toxin-antitoxin system HigB family toxin [Capnocytophaga canimorsus]|uniref:type II toxin-antitoxin system HigB family toxin n=1 Tax=Capnocytophaga canimorsus TaxID=28188 RepID=UPI0037D6F038
MRVIAKKILVDFYTQHADAKTPLEDWYSKVEKAQWSSFAEIKQDFRSVDSVGNKRYVFNIKGNHYRVVALILFVPKTIYIRFIGTHSEYDKIKEIDKI